MEITPELPHFHQTKIREFIRSSTFAPFALSFIFIAILAIFYWVMLPVGTIQHPDEYLTLDRTHSFVIRDDFLTVYSSNRPTFKKPPLQYWISAYLIRQGADLELALRFPSFLFGILTLINVGILAYLLYPTNPWVAPAAIALLAGSFSFWSSNMSALLDSGAMLFSTMAITSCLLAFSRPRWWYLVALSAGLAAIQKAPVPLLLAAGMVLFAFASKKYHQIDFRAAFLNRHFWIAAGLMLAAVLFWPALQWIRFGPESFQEAYVNQMVERFSPFSQLSEARRSWHTVLLSSEALLRIPAILALLVLPWVLRRMDLLPLPFLLVAFAIATVFSSGYVSPRYSLIFLPLLMAALAVVLIKVLPGRALPLLVIAALALSTGGPARSAKALGLLRSNHEKYVQLLQSVAKSLRENETLIVCRAAPGGSRIPAGAISYFASKGRPYEEYRSPETFGALMRNGSVTPPYRGVCHAKTFEELKPLLNGYQIVEESNGYVHWIAH